ncbi:hypothetical protein Tco_1331826 [Tanacetum coccineum]
MSEPLPPDHVFDFPANDLAPELEDLVMEVEEDPMEDLEEDLDMDINEDEEDEWEEDNDWLMASVTPPRAVSLTRSETPPLPIDPIMLSSYQITTSDFIPWIPPTQPNTYVVGGPSLVVPEAPHPVGRLVSVIASRVAQHRREIRALCVKADKMEDMQTRALSLVRKPRMTAVEDGVHTLTEQGVLVASKQDETKTQVLEMRDIVDNYPHGQVDALRKEMDGLHGSIETMSQTM